MAVIISDKAAKEVASIIAQQDLDAATVCLRVGVKGGGCSGFSYLLDITETKKDSDELWEMEYDFKDDAQNGTPGNGAPENGTPGNGTAKNGEVFKLRVICDPKSYLYLNGTEIDFKDELMGRGFVFNNPNATSTCGCGSSFSA